MIGLDFCKAHLNIIDNHDDEYILSLIEIAESTLERELNINLCDIDHTKYNIVQLCVVQLVAAMYQFREAAGSNPNHFTNVFDYVKGLIKNYTENAFG
jgi:hypothetical protein